MILVDVSTVRTSAAHSHHSLEHPDLWCRLCSSLLHSECQKTTAITGKTPANRAAYF